MSIDKSKKIYIYHNLPSGGGLKTFNDLYKYLSNKYRVEVITGINEKPKNFIHYLYLSLIKNLIHDLKLSKRIKSDEVLICFQSWLTNTPPILYLAKCSSKIYICHEPMREYYDSKLQELFDLKDRMVQVLRYPVKLFDKALLNHSKNLIVVVNSSYSKKLLKIAYNLIGTTVYPEIRKFNYNPVTSKKAQVLSVGAVTKYKGFDFLIKVIGNVPELSRPDLLIIGNGGNNKYIQYLKLLAQKNSVKLSIKLNVSDNLLVKSYLESKIYMYAPISEPYGISVVDAMSAHLPIIADYFGGGYSEILLKNEYLIKNRDVKIWALKLTKLLNSSELQSKHGEINYLRSKKLSLTNYGSKIERLL